LPPDCFGQCQPLRAAEGRSVKRATLDQARSPASPTSGSQSETGLRLQGALKPVSSRAGSGPAATVGCWHEPSRGDNSSPEASSIQCVSSRRRASDRARDARGAQVTTAPRRKLLNSDSSSADSGVAGVSTPTTAPTRGAHGTSPGRRLSEHLSGPQRSARTCPPHPGRAARAPEPVSTA